MFTLKSTWQESKHPRVPSGPHGGEFGHGGGGTKPAPVSGRFHPELMQRIRTATKQTDIGSVGTLLTHPKEREQFAAIKDVAIIVDPSRPDHQPAKAVIRRLTPAQKKAGVPAATIYIRPNATAEHIYH